MFVNFELPEFGSFGTILLSCGSWGFRSKLLYDPMKNQKSVKGHETDETVPCLEPQTTI